MTNHQNLSVGVYSVDVKALMQESVDAPITGVAITPMFMAITVCLLLMSEAKMIPNLLKSYFL